MTANQSISSTSSVTQTVDLNDAPEMPTLRLTLRTPKEKQSFYSYFKELFNNSKVFSFFRAKNKENILMQVEKYGCLREEDIMAINQHMDSEIGKVFENFKIENLKLLLINCDDPPEIMLLKIRLEKQIAEGNTKILECMCQRLDSLLKVEDMKERRRLTDELFEKLNSILKKSWDEGSEYSPVYQAELVDGANTLDDADKVDDVKMQ